LDRLQAVLNRAELCPKLCIFGGQQTDTFNRLAIVLWVDRHAPRILERIAVLDPQPGREDPPDNRKHSHDEPAGDDPREVWNDYLFAKVNMVHVISPLQVVS